MLFNPLFLVFYRYLVLFELNLPCFLFKIEKEEDCQNLLFLVVSTQVRLYLLKSWTKKEKLRSDVMKLYLRIMGK